MSPKGTKEYQDFRIYPLKKEEFAKIEAWLADWAIELENLRQVLRRKRVQYDYSLAAAPDHGLPEPHKLEVFVLRLKEVAGLASATGHPNEATDAILEILRLAEVLADHPGWNGQFLRMRFIRIALESLEGMLSAGPIETARLRQLRAGLIPSMNDRFLEQYLTWEQFQLADLASTTAGYRKSLDRMVRGGPAWIPPTLELYFQFAQFTGADYVEGLRSLRHQETLLGIWRLPLVERANPLMALENAGQGSRRRSDFMGFPTFRGDMSTPLMRMELECVSMIHAACAALSIEEYRAKNHRMPQNLGGLDLVRDSNFKINPFNGKPLHLILRATGYSVTGEWSSRASRAGFKCLEESAAYEYRFSVNR